MSTSDPALDADYVKAGFGGKLAFGKRPALVIIDLAVAYMQPGAGLYAGENDVLGSNIRLAAAARAAGVPVVFTKVVYQPGGLDGGLFFKKVAALKAFEEGNPLGAFDPTCAPQDGDIVVSKQYASAFFGTSLASTLHALGVDTTILTGFSTSGCVRASSLDALQNGFIPYVVREACGDRHPSPHEANLFDMQAKYAEVVGEAEALSLIGAVARP